MTEASDMDVAIFDEALAWQAALERDDADWDGYMAWLEADSSHRRAFNAIGLVGAAVNDHRDAIRDILSRPETVTRPHSYFGSRLIYMGGAIAAAVIFVLALPLLQAPPSMQRYEANADAARVVALAGGIDVVLSPASRIVVHGDDAARIELSVGEAYFAVRHEPARTLVVEAGDYRISDIGTRFSVNSVDKVLRVGVSEGTVAVSSQTMTKAVPVNAGHQLIASTAGLTLSPITASDVASWRSGRLSYSNAPLSLVVADITRYSGRPVFIDPSLEKAHFSGSLVIGDGSRLLLELATIVGAQVRQGTDGDRIGAADH